LFCVGLAKLTKPEPLNRIERVFRPRCSLCNIQAVHLGASNGAKYIHRTQSGTDAASLAACFAQDAVGGARRVLQQVIVAYAPDDGRRALEELLPHKDLLWHEQQGDAAADDQPSAASERATLNPRRDSCIAAGQSRR